MPDYNSIPKELAITKQWSFSFSTDKLKRPKHTHYHKGKSLSLMQAWEEAGDEKLIGFYTTKKDEYILGDIDHIKDPESIDELPIGLVDLLKNRGAYSEVSPSGHGIRFILKLASADLKTELVGNTFYTNEEMKDKREAQINIGPPWMTITGNQTSYSASTIGVIDLDILDNAFKIKYKSESTIAPRWDDAPLPKLREIVTALHDIALDQNPRIKRAHKKIFNEEYSHYTFWLKVMMALHDYATQADQNIVCLEELIKWSAKDPFSFDGDEPIIDKWSGFSAPDNKVSYHTLFGLAYANNIKWAKAKPLTKKQKSAGLRIGQPLNAEFSNFKVLLEFYDLKIWRDVHSPVKFYVTGDEDIIDKNFEFMGGQKYLDKYIGVFSERNLTAAMHIFCQEQGFVSISHTQISQFIKNWVFQSKYELDVVKEYFDTPYEELPDGYKEDERWWKVSTVEHMFGSLKIDYMTANKERELDLYQTYYITWLMGMVRNLFYRESFHMNNCVLLLTGPEQIRKTSHFRFMLPKFMRKEYIAFTTHGFNTEGSMRDVVKLSSENLLVVWDEVEQYLDRQSESNFKKIIDNTPQKFIDKYEVIASEVTPMAMYGATSNKREFNLSDTGSRRIFHIPVKWVDTDRLDKICWHRIINDLRKVLREARSDNPPWLLTETQLQYQSRLHHKITNKTGMEFVLSEMFFWELPSCVRLGKLPRGHTNPKKGKHSFTFSAIKHMVALEIGHMPNQIEQIALKRSLVRMCSLYTKTERTKLAITAPRATVYKGQFVYNRVSYFVTPKPKDEEE